MASNFLRRWPLLGLLVLLTHLTGCGEDNGTAKPDTTADAADAGDADDVLVAPKIALELSVDPIEGNAPMPVRLKATFGAAPKSELFLRWEFGDNNPPVTYDLSKAEEAGGDDIEHVYDYKGVYNLKVTASWRRNNKVRDEATATIVVSDPVALAVSQVDLVSAGAVGVGGDVTVTCEVTNTGAEIKTPFPVDLYLSATDIFATDTAYKLGGTTIPSMGSGKGTPVKVSFAWDPVTLTGNPLVAKVPTGIPDGFYYVFVVADAEAKLGDLNRADNATYATSQVQIDNKISLLPDLTMTAPTFGNSTPYSPGEPLIYQHEVKNIGEGESKASKFAVFLSSDDKIDWDYSKSEDDPSQIDRMLTKLGNSTLTKIAPASSLPLYYSVQVPEVPDGEYYLIAAVDVFSVVGETDETNNVAVSSQKITVQKKFIQGVDLALTLMTVKPKGTFLGGSVGVEYTVQNKGNLATTKATKASVYFCSTEAFNKDQCSFNQTDFTIPALAAGETLSKVQVVTISPQTPVQDWFVWVRIDPDNALAELDEGNNVKLFKNLKVTAQQNVDLAVTDIGFHPDTVAAGQPLKFSYVAKNAGTTGSGATTTWIALAKGESCSAAVVSSGQAILLKEVVSSGVDALDEVAIADSVTIPLGLDNGADQYKLCIVLDAKNTLTKETNKANNAANSGQVLTVQGAKGGCFEDSVDLAKLGDKVDDAQPLPADATAMLGSCGDEDWWQITVPKGHSLLVTLQTTPILSTSPVSSALDIDLVGPDKTTLLDTQRLLSQTKKATALTVASGGTHYIRIYGNQPGVLAQYQLNAQVLAPVNGIDLLAGNLQVQPGATFPGALVKTKFKLTNLGNVSAGALQVRYVLSKDGLLSVDDLEIDIAALPNGVTASQTAELQRTLILPVVAGGLWYVLAEVDAQNQVAEANESNNLAQSNSLSLNTQVACETDAFSGNHTPGNAAALPPTGGQYTALSVCPGLPDWYAVEVADGKALEVALNWKYQPGKGLVGLQILDASATGVLAGSAQAVGTKASIPYTQVGGIYYVHVYVLPEAGGAVPYPYDIDVQVKEPDPTDVCLADYYESNNSSSTAPEIGCGLSNLSLCLGDEDWFVVEMQEGEEISFEFNSESSAFALKVFANPNLPPLKTQASNGTLPFVAATAGKYWLQVSYKSPGTKPKSFAYTLKLNGGKGTDLLATLQSVFPGQVVQGEDVYLTVQLRNECPDPAGSFQYGYYYSLNSELDAGDTLMALRPVSGGLPGKSTLEVDDKAIVPSGAKPGPAYVIVAADAQNEVAESQELNNADAKPLQVIELCLEDILEPNGSPQIAKDLPMGRSEDLSLCPYDLDWYQVDLQAGESLTVTAEFVQTTGDLDIRLYEVGKFAAPVAVSATKKSPEQLTFTAPKASKYYLRVSGFAGESNAYALQVCKSLNGPCVECADDSWCGYREICDGKTTLCTALPCLPQDATTVCNDNNDCTADSCTDGLCVNAADTGAPCDDGDACTLGEACVAEVCTTATTETAFGLSDAPTDTLDATADVVALPGGGFATIGTRSLAGIGLVGEVKRYAADGKMVWLRTYGLSSAPSQLRAGAMAGSTLLAVGQTQVKDKPGSQGAWYVQIDLATGLTTTEAVFDNGTTLAGFDDIAVGESGMRVAVGAGFDPANAAAGQQAMAMRLDSEGTPLWLTFAGGNGADSLQAVAVSATDVIVAVGETEVAGVVQALALRMTPAGVVSVQAMPGKDGARATLRDITPIVGGWVMAGAKETTPSGTATPNWEAWLVTTSLGLIVDTEVTVPGSLPQTSEAQATAYKGVPQSFAHAFWRAPDGTTWLAGWAGAPDEATYKTDATLWQLAADGTVLGSWAKGGADRDALQALIPFGYGVLGAGSTAELEAKSDGLRLLVLPPALPCADGNACTADSCSPTSGCVFGPGGCSDGDACTQDFCDQTSGCGHLAATCNDNSVCTTDSCSAGNGCLFAAVNCNDNDPCTTDSCQATTGCQHDTLSCDDSDACTNDSCGLATGCTSTAVDCDDDDACTTDSCDPASGCKYSDVTCNDGNACTSDNCDLASGCTTTNLDCNDGNACTNDSCDQTTGCQTSMVACDDNNACTSDSCDLATGCLNALLTCNDNSICTSDSCDPASGCQTSPVVCDDGNACTTDSCDLAVGCTVTAVDCEDGDDCTDDACDLATGCTTTAHDCSDGSVCTVDLCADVTGCYWESVSCDDADACTVDSCDAIGGCTYETAICSDGDLCTVDDCDSAVGCSNDATICDDGDLCTSDACDLGIGCTATTLICSDSDDCTVDSCDPVLGCQYVPVVCEDNEPCTDNLCGSGGACSYPASSCDDANSCTTDSCSPGVGCEHLALSGNEPCSLGQGTGSCVLGQCVE